MGASLSEPAGQIAEAAIALMEAKERCDQEEERRAEEELLVFRDLLYRRVDTLYSWFDLPDD